MINGARVREYRKRLKLTQGQLGQLIGVSQGKICKLEKQRQDTGIAIAERLRWALRRPGLDDLL
ncbi:MAG: helix-turn-helix transcriptional regulator [Flavobacteriales bacterium]|nr:helix-turn-helix transcriptional regulator [Flavobacteriales bacterium]MCC6938109.1 helix-turn-helix transcriptional regulator [Flavobacteriales bacterium]